MPLLRYFLYVGGCLVALLLIVDASVPLPQVSAKATSDVDRSVIRITSERKSPPAIVFDTSQPMTVAVPVSVPVAAAVTAVEQPAEQVRQAFAQMQPDLTPVPKPVAAKIAPPKPKKAKVAKRQNVRQNIIAFRQDGARDFFPTW